MFTFTPHDTAGGPAPTEPSELPATMRAAGRHHYGGTDVIESFETDTPTVGPRTVLVEVKAVGLNPLDDHMMTGTPWLVRTQAGFRRPKLARLGLDMSGRVIAVGDEVTRFAPGDEVVGTARGSCAEYVAAQEDKIVRKPVGCTFDEAAGLPVAAITALQGLRDKAGLQAGQHVLINGASGGVGTAAIQIAKSMGATVTAVCSTRNLDLVRELGADHVVDYTNDDFTDTAERYDVLFDNQGNRTLAESRRILTDDGVYLLVGGPKKNRLLGPIGRMVRALVRFAFASQRATAFVADENADDLQHLADLMKAGELRTVIDRTYPLAELRTAMEHLRGGHARGKVIVNP